MPGVNESPEERDAKGKPLRKHRLKTAIDIFMMLVWVFASVIVAQLIVGYLMIFAIGVDAFMQPVPTAVYSALSYIVAMMMVIVVPILLSWVRNKDAKKEPTLKKELRDSRGTLGLDDWPTWTDIGLAPIGFVAYLLLAAVFVSFFSLFPWFDAAEAQEVGFSYYVSGFDKVVAFLTLVVIAPIAEEIIFRGWLYGNIRKKLARHYSLKFAIFMSILLVSVLFGIVHMQWNVGVNVFALSIVLCGLREITGTIHAGILLHMLKNGVAFFILYMGFMI